VGDIADRALVTACCPPGRKASCTSRSSRWRVDEVPETFFRNNTATLSLLEALLAHGVKEVRLLSTAALFGNPAASPSRRTTELAPTNAYGSPSSGGAHARLVQPHPRPALRGAALLQRRRRHRGRGRGPHPETHLIPLVLQVALGKRRQREHLGTDYPTPTGHCVRDYIRCVTSRRPTCLALGAPPERDAWSTTWATARASRLREVVQAARKVTGHASPWWRPRAARRPGHAGGELAASAPSWAGSRVTPTWRPSSPARGSGTGATGGYPEETKGHAMTSGNSRSSRHRRFNPLTGEWILVSPHRTQRPWRASWKRWRRRRRSMHDPAATSAPVTIARAA